MLFNVSQLLREPVGSSRHPVLEPEAPVHRGTVEMIRVPSGVLVRCDADVLIDTTCSRCLAPIATPEHIRFEEIFAQQLDPVTGQRLAEPDDPEAFRIDLNHMIDITEAVRQYTEMATEMQPLCREDCPGICSECGQDLSLGICACDRAPLDSRWAALAGLKLGETG
ncbi:MAG: DUF177 domain-containing protein [Dehalococcoidia bacterium]|nr:DUF177 domain-containing protein [Dehalococcoidia bacterium]